MSRKLNAKKNGRTEKFRMRNKALISFPACSLQKRGSTTAELSLTLVVIQVNKVAKATAKIMQREIFRKRE